MAVQVAARRTGIIIMTIAMMSIIWSSVATAAKSTKNTRFLSSSSTSSSSSSSSLITPAFVVDRSTRLAGGKSNRQQQLSSKPTTSITSLSSSLKYGSSSSFYQRRSFSSSSPLSMSSNDDNEDDTTSSSFFADSDVTFESIGIQSPILLERLQTNLGLNRPTQIQEKAFTEIRGSTSNDDDDDTDDNDTNNEKQQKQNYERSTDVTIGAETGSGKTLAYLLPLLDDILCQKEKAKAEATDSNGLLLPTYDYARAFILVPNKELVQQVLRMAVPLCGGTIDETIVWAPNSGGGDGEYNNPTMEALKPLALQKSNNDPSTLIRLAVMPGGLREPLDFKPFRDSIGFGGDQPPVDIVITTPAALAPMGLPPKFIDLFADVSTLVVDEADMLLDGGYIRSLENVLMGFKRADRLSADLNVKKTQHVFVAATLPDVGLKSVDAYLQKKFPYANRINTNDMHNAKHYGLSQETKWYQVETKKERMERLVEMLLNEDEDNADVDSLKGEKTMVFLNSVDDVESVHQALVQRGINAVPYHAKISLNERSENLDRFRRYDSDNADAGDTVPVLICTDLASRGLDVPGVTAVVQLQFSGNVVSHLHRMGRCGRAGNKSGRGIIFYDEYEIELIEVVQDAERQQEKMQLSQDVDDRDDDDDDLDGKGKVKKAFSRKRGFTKKRKKLRREAAGETTGGDGSY
jgi:superfamily II DNA/RNA helicase